MMMPCVSVRTQQLIKVSIDEQAPHAMALLLQLPQHRMKPSCKHMYAMRCAFSACRS